MKDKLDIIEKYIVSDYKWNWLEHEPYNIYQLDHEELQQQTFKAFKELQANLINKKPQACNLDKLSNVDVSEALAALDTLEASSKWTDRHLYESCNKITKIDYKALRKRMFVIARSFRTIRKSLRQFVELNNIVGFEELKKHAEPIETHPDEYEFERGWNACLDHLKERSCPETAWQPIEAMLKRPKVKNGARIILGREKGCKNAPSYCWIGHYNKTHKEWILDYGIPTQGVEFTHGMPLPEPPKKEGM